MRNWFLAVVLGLASAVGSAESLEESYATLCDNGEQNETCDILRKGLLEKLTRQSSGELATNAELEAQGESTLSPVWGPWADLADTYWESNYGSVLQYRWREPGKVLVEESTTLPYTNERQIKLSPDEQALLVDFNGESLAPTPLSAGEYAHSLSKQLAQMRQRYRFEPETITTQLETDNKGQWQPYAYGEPLVLKPVSKEVFDQRLAAAQEFRHKAAEPNEIARRWGAFAQLAGYRWETKIFRGYKQIESYRWIDPGLVLEKRTTNSTGTLNMKSEMRLDHTGNLLAYTVDSQGTAIMSSELPDGSRVEHRTEMTGPGAYRYKYGTYKNGKYSSMQDYRYRQVAIPGTKKRDSSGSRAGLVNALIGASVGAYGASAAGIEGEQALGLMMKGAQAASPGSEYSAALGNTGDELLSGGAASSSPAGGASSGGASYPTKPNLATGACTGFTEQNYRTKALQGGGDAQLYTMCGQAFEYYTMYKRAIAQGYSEADANRTYAAHEQSARVARGYLSSHGAN